MWFQKIALILAAIGAINWGTAAFDYNLVNMLLGSISIAETIVYVIVALCGLYTLYVAIARKIL